MSSKDRELYLAYLEELDYKRMEAILSWPEVKCTFKRKVLLSYVSWVEQEMKSVENKLLSLD